MNDFDQFERRLAGALRADADLSLAGFDASAAASTAIGGGRRGSLRRRLAHLLAPRLAVPRLAPALVVLALALALLAGAIATGALRQDRSHPISLSPTGPASTAAEPSASRSRATSWTAGRGMGTPRWGHIATLLANGRVLVVGGRNGVVQLSSAELYDPSTGTWSPTGSMVGHVGGDFSATLLRDGRVLVAGGGRGGDLYQPVADAELYDPATGSWTATGSMNAPRSGHLAALLPDGRVLVAGGVELNSAELYDPATGTWAPTGSMAQPRYRAAAALLLDGRVLVAGGATDPTPTYASLLDSAELYDPVTRAWTAGGRLSTVYVNAAAVVLPSGDVLVAASPPQLYHPVDGSWSAAPGATVSGWSGPAAVLADGRAFVLGAGRPGQDVAVDTTAAIYDPIARSWSAAGALSALRWGYTATLLEDGRVLVAGGWDGTVSSDTTPAGLATVEIFDPGDAR